MFFPHTDIAIGAPQEDSGTGKVYIYHGSAQGIKTTPAQVDICLENYITSVFCYSLNAFMKSGLCCCRTMLLAIDL